MSKVILITNAKSEVAKVEKMALENKHSFVTYTEDEWATVDDIDEYIQDEDELPKIVALPVGHRTVFSLEEVESEAIKRAINNVNGNAVKAAKVLKIGRATLYRKLEKYGLSLKQVRDNNASRNKAPIPIGPLKVVKKVA